MNEADRIGAERGIDRRPVFIAGCGRSGTTYLRTIVAAHPDVFIPSESLFIADYLRYGDAVPRRLLEWLYYHEPQLRSWYDGPPRPIDDVPAVVRDCHEASARAEGARVWGQKTPRFVRYMPEFERAFPGCKWILIYRDPRAVVASHLRSPRHTYSVDAAARRWVRDNEPICRFVQAGSAPDHVMLVKYEDLILDFDAHLGRLFRFVGVSPLSRAEVMRLGKVWEFRGTGFNVEENNLRDGLEPQPKTIDAWRKHLTEAQVRRVDQLCSRGMRILGYEPLQPGDAEPPPGPIDALRRSAERLRDMGVVYEYMTKWPIYPTHTLLRKAVLRTFALTRRLGFQPPRHQRMQLRRPAPR